MSVARPPHLLRIAQSLRALDEQGMSTGTDELWMAFRARLERVAAEKETGLVRELLTEAEQRLDDMADWGEHEDEDEVVISDDPNAPPAPAPLVVIQPRHASLVPSRHPYRGTRQYRAARAAWHDGPGRKWVDVSHLSSLEAVYGEGPAGVVLSDAAEEPDGAVGAPTRVSSAAVAARHLLHFLPRGRSLDEYRKCLGRGRKSADQRADYLELADAVVGVLAAGVVTIAAISAALGCNPKTVDALSATGRRRVRTNLGS